MAVLQRDHPESVVRAVILGEGPERPNLEKRAAAQGVSLLLPGFVADPYPCMAGFDIAVLPSRAEGMPLVVLETMALGVATVATPVGGCREILRDGETGRITPVGDVPALAGILGQLVSDPAGRSRLGSAAARAIQHRHTLETMVQGYDAFLTRTTSRWYGREASANR
jgi:glycosyltransferase involved in cell wall biosynthesis